MLLMKFDPQTIRLLGRVTDHMNQIRKNPHRYQVQPAVEAEISAAAHKLESLLNKVTTIKAG